MKRPFSIARSLAGILCVSTCVWLGSVRTVSGQNDVWRPIGPDAPDGGPDTVYASITVVDDYGYMEAFGRGVFKTDDGGNTWASANAGLNGFYVHALAIDSQVPSSIYAIAGSQP